MSDVYSDRNGNALLHPANGGLAQADPSVAPVGMPAGVPGFAGASPGSSRPGLSPVMAFAGRAFGDMAGMMTALMGIIGERLGLFRVLAAMGPASVDEFARAASVDPRYARGWLHALVSAGYLTFDAEEERYALPQFHAPFLVNEKNPLFIGGGYQQLAAFIGQVDRLVGAFRTGAGIPQQDYDRVLIEGMDRISARWFDYQLVQQWLAALPEVVQRLQGHARVADIGCGSGRAVIRLAEAFPTSSFVGFDSFAPAVSYARLAAEKARVGARARFEVRDITDGLPDSYDLITAFDVLHDFNDPVAGLSAMTRALKDDGAIVVLEVAVSDNLNENLGPMGTILHGTALLYGIPVSIANGGRGGGTTSMPPGRLEQTAVAAGLRLVKRVAVDTPWNAVYELRR
jgi:SAM-dependent methyltransferase